ncbi:uncharacterized protein LOC123319308 [Coccinella septempunctata]|uniref:uncharacterized protein LOC123319308 n=1 Tax=Coccinella septempunctata TaxID=41139 RepID=UPI001D09771D|nr:uncharacterized protein LOC123319308 [Coccinella septempunctata]
MQRTEQEIIIKSIAQHANLSDKTEKELQEPFLSQKRSEREASCRVNVQRSRFRKIRVDNREGKLVNIVIFFLCLRKFSSFRVMFRKSGVFVLTVVSMMMMMMPVDCWDLDALRENRKNDSSVSKKVALDEYDTLEEITKALTNMLFTGRKKGGGGNGMSMFFMRTLMDMFNATVPMMAMTVMGWMKDIMLMGSGAFMMMMYDMLSKRGQEKKIIIKLAQPPPPEPAPPAQTGYGPWEG